MKSEKLYKFASLGNVAKQAKADCSMVQDRDLYLLLKLIKPYTMKQTIYLLT